MSDPHRKMTYEEIVHGNQVLQGAIERLSAEIERLRAALAEIAKLDFKMTAEQAADHYQEVARNALNQQIMTSEEIDAAAKALFEQEQPVVQWAAVDEVERNEYRLRLSRQQRTKLAEPEAGQNPKAGQDPEPGRV